MAYTLIPGKRRALCCVCGTVRTSSVNYHGRRSVHRGEQPAISANIAHIAKRNPNYAAKLNRGWRCVAEMKCDTCGNFTRHAYLRDHDDDTGRNLAEDEDHARPLRVDLGGQP